MSAGFEVRTAFSITGRGLVLSGRVAHGTVQPGMVLSLPSGTGSQPIQSVEFVRRLSGEETGLVLGHVSGREEAELGSLVGSVLDAYDPSSGSHAEAEASE